MFSGIMRSYYVWPENIASVCVEFFIRVEFFKEKRLEEGSSTVLCVEALTLLLERGQKSFGNLYPQHELWLECLLAVIAIGLSVLSD